jgi:2-amino-4-hydroxy-6-hydroxymethyldihydropteridine diphosphokinase
MASRRWLLLLGSNLPHDGCMTAALARLSQCGETTALTPIRRFAAHDGGRGEYFNALATLASELDAPALAGRLKQLEAELGRRRDASGQVAIDLDILACADADGAWRADAHAMAKREFVQPPVASLLREAGIALAT